MRRYLKVKRTARQEHTFKQARRGPPAPVFLKNPHRIEALFTLCFLALLIQALIERELRQAMQRERLKELPLYPEQRACKRPTTEQILRLFSLAERHTLLRSGRIAQVFPAAEPEPYLWGMCVLK